MIRIYPQPFCVVIKGREGYNVVGILEEAAHDIKNIIPYAVIILCETRTRYQSICVRGHILKEGPRKIPYR